MAAAMSSPWGKPGAWALEAEEHEAELLRQPPAATEKSDLSAEFPSLAAAAATKTSKKKNKGQTLSLSEFIAGPTPMAERLTADQHLSLPTGPRQRSAEELDRSKLGGGFKNYGSSSRHYDREDSSSRWGSSSSRVSEDGGRRGSRESAPPSRADEIDNWAAAKRPPAGNGFERRERGGFFGSQESKADEVDSWAANKTSGPPRRFGSGFSSGNRCERRGSFDSLSRNRETPYSGGSDSDSWGKKKEERTGGSGGMRPRLVLQPRTLHVTNGKPDSPVAVEKPEGANPFGNARPREEVLAEKGTDWKEIDEKLEAVKIKDAVGEKGDGSFGKRSFGLGNGWYGDRDESSWRKSPEKTKEGPVEEKNGPVEETNEQAVEQN